MCYFPHNKIRLHFVQLIFDYITKVANFVRKSRLKNKNKVEKIKINFILK